MASRASIGSRHAARRLRGLTYALTVSLLLFSLSACDRGPAEEAAEGAATAAVATAVDRSTGARDIPTSLAIPDAPPTLPAEPFSGGPPPALDIAPAAESGASAAPLAWSPDGASLLALSPTGAKDGAGRAMGRLVVLDGTGALRWNSGDVEAPIGGPAPGAWLADGTLALARRDGTFVRSDGSQAGDAAGLEGQPREVWMGPRRQRALLLGPEGAFVVSPGQAALRLEGWPRNAGSSTRAGFAWSPEGGRIALSTADGAHQLFDVSTGAAALLLQDGSAPWEAETAAEGWPAPAWLADGRLLLGTQTRMRYSDGDAFDHRILNASSARAEDLSPAFGLPPAERPREAHVSPDGRYLILRAAEASGSGPSWLIDVLGLEAVPLADPGRLRWAPGSDRWLRLDAEGMALITRRGADERWLQQAIPLESAAGLSDAVWSPDGRWLLLMQADGALTLVDAEGLAAPLGLGLGFGFGVGPGRAAPSPDSAPVEPPLHAAWSADGKRLALRLVRSPEPGPSGDTAADGARLHIIQLAPGP